MRQRQEQQQDCAHEQNTVHPLLSFLTLSLFAGRHRHKISLIVAVADRATVFPLPVSVYECVRMYWLPLTAACCLNTTVRDDCEQAAAALGDHAHACMRTQRRSRETTTSEQHTHTLTQRSVLIMNWNFFRCYFSPLAPAPDPACCCCRSRHCIPPFSLFD